MSRQERLLIMVVDDEPLVAILVQEILEGNGYQVTVAGDGRSALELLRSRRPDLVLLDILMPDIDGYAVCARTQQTTRHWHRS